GWGAVRARPGERNRVRVAASVGGKVAIAARPGAAVGGVPVAQLRLAAHEAPAGGLGVVPLVRPSSVDEQSHGHDLRCDSPACGTGSFIPRGSPWTIALERCEYQTAPATWSVPRVERAAHGHARPERSLVLRASRRARWLRARRPCPRHPEVEAQPPPRAARGAARRAPAAALDPALRGDRDRPGLLRA